MACWFCGVDNDEHHSKCPRYIQYVYITPKEPGKCTACGTELSKELDAYYGFDAVEATRCVKCRKSG